MAAGVWRDAGKPGATAGPGERLFDAASRRRVIDIARRGVGQAIGAAEHATLAMRQVGERRNKAGMQGNAARLAVLRVAENHVAAGKVEVAPVEPKRLADPRAGQEQALSE